MNFFCEHNYHEQFKSALIVSNELQTETLKRKDFSNWPKAPSPSIQGFRYKRLTRKQEFSLPAFPSHKTGWKFLFACKVSGPILVQNQSRAIKVQQASLEGLCRVVLIAAAAASETTDQLRLDAAGRCFQARRLNSARPDRLAAERLSAETERLLPRVFCCCWQLDEWIIIRETAHTLAGARRLGLLCFAAEHTSRWLLHMPLNLFCFNFVPRAVGTENAAGAIH